MLPDSNTAKTAVVVLPGFTRQASDLGLFVQDVQTAGFPCTAISLAPKYFPIMYMNRRHLRSIAARIASGCAEHQIVLVGHSAGAAAATYVATVLRDCGVQVKGLVYADGVDSPNRLITKYLGNLEDVRVSAVLAPPSSCNRQGSLEHLLMSHPRVEVNVIEGAGHGDIEGAGIQVYRRFCADTSSEDIAQAFRQALVGQIEQSIGSTDYF